MKKATVCTVFLLCLLRTAAHASGLLIPTNAEIPPLAIKYQRVNVEIAAQVAETHVEQVFVNSTGRQLEATYVFPLPEGPTMTSGSGLAKLDHIDGGVSNLKLSDPKSLKTVSPPSPTKDSASESKDDFLKAMQGMGQGKGGGGDPSEGAKNAKEATAATEGQIDPRTGSPYGAVPESVIKQAYTCAADGGTRCCPGQCTNPTGGAVDEKVRITPNGDDTYSVQYEGTQTDTTSGSSAQYIDGAKIHGDGYVEPAGSKVSCNGGQWQSVAQDCPPPDCNIQATPDTCKTQRGYGHRH